MARLTHQTVAGERYARFGWGPCDDCSRYRLLYYSQPQVYSERVGRALCYPCLKLAAVSKA